MAALDALRAHVTAFAAAHPVAFSLVVLPLAISILNVAIWYFTSPKWPQLQRKNPRVAALAKLLKAAGIDPVGILKWGFLALTGRPWTPPKR